MTRRPRESVLKESVAATTGDCGADGSRTRIVHLADACLDPLSYSTEAGLDGLAA